jgi:hypothetical protein
VPKHFCWAKTMNVSGMRSATYLNDLIPLGT